MIRVMMMLIITILSYFLRLLFYTFYLAVACCNQPKALITSEVSTLLTIVRIEWLDD
jgi:hypothetical protein